MPSVRRKSRLASADFASFFIRSSPPLRHRPSWRQRESTCFNLYEHATERSGCPIEIGSLRLFKIGKEAPHPWRDVMLEELALCLRRSAKPPAGEPPLK